MNSFRYRVSIIVPVFNVEKQLKSCLDSLLMQTMPLNDMEVLLINDGSTDNSLKICHEYASIYSCFHVIDKNNEGVSATRNLGIKLAEGKYIMYLDADDMLSENTVENVINFFDSVYDQIDVVTYKRVMYYANRKPVLIDRYRWLTTQGIYDLTKIPYCTQSTLNIAVKNKKDIFFDTDLFQGEDQKYVIEHILPRLKLGYCSDAEYKYVRHENSAVSKQSYSYYLFEQHMKLWEEILKDCPDTPKWIQAIILDNWTWELKSDCIFPYHYKGDQYQHAMKRIENILSHIDTDTILNHPKMDTFHKHFWISMKPNSNATFMAVPNRHFIIENAKVIYESKKIEIILHKIDIREGKLIMWGFIKSPIFNYTKEKPELFFDIDGTIEQENLFESIHSYYGTTAHTNYFWGFKFEQDVKSVRSLTIFVKLDDIRYDCKYYCMPAAIFNKKLGVSSYIRSGYRISFDFKDTFTIRSIDKQEKNYLIQNIDIKNADSKINKLRQTAVYLRKNVPHRIWLYSDSNTTSVDNAYFQFQYDWKKEDEVERWYIYDGNVDEIASLFSDDQKENLIEYGSTIHKLLFLQAEYVICSFSDKRPRIPFSNDAEYAFFRDLSQPLVIYLQHGVCHADLRYLQSVERCKVDKIVVSSKFEANNFINNYHYRKQDILLTGMARFDYINKNASSKNKIIFAPSWRSYLLSKEPNGKWECDASRVTASDYFIKTKEFLNSKSLLEFLEKYDLVLDFKFHPHMKSVFDLFDIDSPRIKKRIDQVNLEDYKLFITDFSSFVFDFAFLCRPIVYFVPDLVQFESGMNHYRKLDLPFEKAFGNLATEADDAVSEIERIAINQWKPDELFSERMNQFYLPIENAEEELYDYLYTLEYFNEQ